MNLLTIRLEGLEVALLAAQVARVDPWPSPGKVRATSLAELLGLGSPGETVRLIVAHGASAGALVPGHIERLEVRSGAVYGVPRVLARLGAPGWLRGFVAKERGVCPLVDLPELLAFGARLPESAS